MRLYAERKSSSPRGFVCGLVLLGLCVSLGVPSASVHAQTTGTDTTIGATICSTGSSVALTKPDSDAVVTSSTVAIEGAVDQASQIEVRVDDAYNSSIPLSVGQTTFTGSVEISAGTHTIKVTAIHTCSSNNAEDSVVVTYEVPPQTPSNGSDTPTTAGGVTYGGDGVSKTDNSHSEGTGVIDAALTPVKDLASWLNVKIDEGSTNMASLSLARATTFTVGLSLAIIGVAPVVAGAVASSPMVVGLLPAAMPSRRLFIVGSAGRIIGVFLAVGSLFL